MSNGLGAGLFALSIVAALAGLAAVLALVAAAAVALHRRTGRVPAPVRYLAVAALAVVVAVAGFGVLALPDEVPVAAGLLVVAVPLPLAVAGYLVRRATALGPLDVLAAAALAWSLPYLAGVAVFLGVVVGADATLGLAPVESRRLGLPWVAVAVAGLAAIAGAALLGDRVAGVLASNPPPGGDP